MSAPSMRRSLLIRCGLGIGVLLCILSASIYLLVRNSLYGEIDDSIQQTAAILSNQVELENDTITYEWREGLGTNRSLIEGALFQFWDEKTASTSRSPGLHWRDLPKFSGVDGAPLLRNIELSDGHHARAVGLRIFPFVLPEEVEAMKLRGEVIDPRTLPQTLVVARDAEPAHRALARLRWVLATGSLLTLGLGFVLIERAIRSSLRPIDQLSSQVQDRAGHQLDAALDLPEDLPLELTGLATNFDLLLTRVAAIRQRERDFIRHAAHELRTPIAGLRATTDLALSQSRDAAAYATHLASCQKTAVELGELVKRLSAIARIGTAASPALKEKVDLSALAADSLSQFLSRMTERDLSVENTTKGKNLAALGDPALVRIVLNNLFDNAVSYAVRGGRIVVAGRSNADGVEIAVANTVEDFPEDPDRLFEPLFRREESRHDAASHLGIGLTLSLEAARAMGGSLRVGKTEEGMIAFCLVLPAVG